MFSGPNAFLGGVMNKIVKNWSGLLSIIWMISGYIFILRVLAPLHLQFPPFWLYALVLSCSWLGVGLLFAVAGLSRASLLGRISSLFAIGLFVFFAWVMIDPVFQHAHTK